MKRPAIKTNVRDEIINTLDLATISKTMEDEAIKSYHQGSITDFFVPVGKFILMPESLLKYDDETINGVCLEFLNKNFTDCQVSVFRKQRSKRHRIAFAKCAMISIMVVAEM